MGRTRARAPFVTQLVQYFPQVGLGLDDRSAVVVRYPPLHSALSEAAFTAHRLGGYAQRGSSLSRRLAGQTDPPQDIALNYAGSFLSVAALAELIALIILPVYKRMVFVAGMEMISHIFLMTAVRTLATWAVQTEYVQAMIRNSTEAMVKTFEQEAKLRTLKTEL